MLNTSDGCIATAPGDETITTTTTIPITTTTVITTTTTTITTTTTAGKRDLQPLISLMIRISACDTCVVGDITFTEGDLGQGTETPVPSDPVEGADGCLSLVVTCPATNTGPIFMQFNGDQGGPNDPTGANDVNATLECRNGVWVYAPEGQEERVITEVNCIAA